MTDEHVCMYRLGLLDDWQFVAKLRPWQVQRAATNELPHHTNGSYYTAVHHDDACEAHRPPTPMAFPAERGVPLKQGGRRLGERLRRLFRR